MSVVLKNDHGVLHAPLALLTLIFVLSGLGLWSLLHHWKTQAQTQLRLDRCTGQTALELKDQLKAVASANQHIRELRTAEAAALLIQPEVAQGMELATEAESLHQEAIRADWMLRQARWAFQTGCDSSEDVSSLLPSLDWTRDPPDELGAQPLDLGALAHSYRFEVRHPPRASAAEVYSEGETHGLFKSPRWRARWIQPMGILGTSLH